MRLTLLSKLGDHEADFKARFDHARRKREKKKLKHGRKEAEVGGNTSNEAGLHSSFRLRGLRR